MPSIATLSARQLYGGTVQGLGFGAWNQVRTSASVGNIPGGNAATQAGPPAQVLSQGPGVTGGATMPNGAPVGGASAGKASPGGIIASIIGIAILLAVLWFAAHKTGEGKEFANVKASGVNILIIGLTAMIFFLLAKLGAAKFPNNPVSQVIMAA
jgi:hypothetical protein